MIEEVDMKTKVLVMVLGSMMFAMSCDSRDPTIYDDPAATVGEQTFKAEVWADNWFALYVGDELVKEDSVPITTERSFNSETFEFVATYPFTINVVMKDFKENDSGLEYIGANNQQMGDGGFIAQITNTQTGATAAVSDGSWRCKVIHKAPLNKECEGSSEPLTDCQWSSEEEPAGWREAGYDTSAWDAATEHTEADVSPKDGYDEISWTADAKLIWGADLEADNTVLCSITVGG